MKKYKIRKTIAAALVAAMSSALLAGYNYPVEKEKAVQTSEPADPAPKLHDGRNENGFVEVNMFSGQLKCGNTTIERGPQPGCSVWHGTPIYQYSRTETGPYSEDLPDTLGTWYVRVVVEEDDEYYRFESAPVSFKVKEENGWVSHRGDTYSLECKDTTIVLAPSPTCRMQHGEPQYQYSQNEAGPYSDHLPDKLGTWYVRVVVEEDDEYFRFKSEPVSFHVRRDDNCWINELTIPDITFGEEPRPNAEAAYGTVTYQYSQAETGAYTDVPPIFPGVWYVKAVVAAGDTYEGLESAPVRFEVGKMKNEWTTKLTMFDVILGDKPEPKAGVAHGTVKYQYSRNEEGPYSEALPDIPGTWYVRAIVPENETYALLESEPVSFVLIDLGKYLPPFVEPGNAVMTPTDAGATEKKSKRTAEKSEENTKKSGNKAAKESMDAVKTGDHTSVTAYLLLLSCGFALLLIMSKKNSSTKISNKNGLFRIEQS